MTEPLDFLRGHMNFQLADYPAQAWRIAADLPDIHRDPINRMLIAHAMVAEMTLIAADKNSRRYPVNCI